MDGQTYSAIVDATVWTVNDLTAGNPSGNSPPGRLNQLRDRQFYKGSLANATYGSTMLFGLCYFGLIPSLLRFLANEIRLSKGLPVFRNVASNSGSI